MLILVGVTVTVSLNGGLFEKAKEGAKGTTIARVKEQITGEIAAKIAAKIADNLGENITQGELEEIAAKYGKVENGELTLTGSGYKIALSEIWKVDSNENTLASIYCSIENCQEKGHLHQGDYVNYTPMTDSNTYKPDGDTAGTLTGYTEKLQEIVKTEDLNWRVMGKDKNGNILLISDKPTNEKLTFHGYIGWNNFETVLNTACNTLYSNKALGATAQSLTITDIENYIKESDKLYYAENETSEEGFGYSSPNDMESKFEFNSKDNILTEKKCTISAGEIKSNVYSYYIGYDDDSETGFDLNNLSLNILFGESEDAPYESWLASRGVTQNENYTYFHIGGIANWTAGKRAGTLCTSAGNRDDSFENSIRPVVVLPSTVTTEQVKKI